MSFILLLPLFFFRELLPCFHSFGPALLLLRLLPRFCRGRCSLPSLSRTRTPLLLPPVPDPPSLPSSLSEAEAEIEADDGEALPDRSDPASEPLVTLPPPSPSESLLSISEAASETDEPVS